MQIDFGLRVEEPTASGVLDRPWVTFKVRQLNQAPRCMSEQEIDEQVDALIGEVERLRKDAKKQYKAARARHDKYVAERREKQSQP